MVKKMHNNTPLLFSEHNFTISKKGQYSIFFKVKHNEVFTLDQNSYKEINKLWDSALKLLPSKALIHKQDYFFEEKYFPKNETITSDADKEYFATHIEKPYLNHYAYLSFSLISDKKSVLPDIFKNNNEIKRFNEKVDSIKKIFNASKVIVLTELTNDELIGDQGLLAKYNSLEKQNKPHTIRFNKNYLEVGNKFMNNYILEQDGIDNQIPEFLNHKTLSTENSILPHSLLFPLGLNFKKNHLVDTIIYLPEKDSFIASLKRKRNPVKSLSKFGSNLNNLNDYENYFNEINTGKTPCLIFSRVGSWTEDYTKISELNSDLENAYQDVNFKPTPINYDLKTIFNGCYPGNCAAINFDRDSFITHNEIARSFFINETNYETSISDFGVKLNDRITGIPLHVDISDTPLERSIISNRNKLIFGPSGSGKSFFTNHLIRTYLKQQAHTVIIDVGDSYKRTCLHENGVYFTYEEDNPLSFNPFYIPKNQTLKIDKIESIKTLIFTIWKKDADDFTNEEDSILLNALLDYYKRDDLIKKFDTFYDFIVNDYKKVIQRKNQENQFDIASFKTVLEKFKTGQYYGYLLNSEQNIDLLNTPLIVFELEKIKDNATIFPIVTLIIMETFINKMLSLKGVRKVILIEEAWKAMSSDIMAKFMKYLYKTCRKYFGEAILVTQEVEDILENDIVKNAIIKNSGCKILLDMKDYLNDFDQIQNYLNITQHASANVLSINQSNREKVKYKEVAIILGNYAKVYGLEVSKYEYYLYTTEEQEAMKVYEEIDKFQGNIELAINNLITKEIA